MEWIITLILIVIVFYLFIFKRSSNASNFPPGPLIFSSLGSIPSCLHHVISMMKGKTRYELLWKMSQKYGPIIGLMAGTAPVVVLNGYETIKQVFSREEFANKPNRHPSNVKGYSKQLGIFFHNGPGWREQRRFTLRHLRDFGFGRRSMEIYIHEEARALFNVMETEDFDLLTLLPVLSIRLIWSIVAGGCKDENLDFKEFTRTILSIFNENNAVFGMFLPVLNKIPVFNASYLRLREKTEYVLRVIQACIKNHEESFDENDIRDFMDVYIQEIRANKSADSSFTREQLGAICVDLFTAGTDTSAGTLSYALRHLIQNIEAQNKLRNEIHIVVGTERLPAMDDVPRLHYTQAVIAETLRCTNPIPIFPRSVTIDTEFGGYTIPKDAFILINLWSVNMEPEIWGDPENFRPERFLADDGRYQKNEHLLAFGGGSRACPGESLARYSTLLYLTALVQRYQFRSHGTQPLNGHIEGFTTMPAHFKMHIERITT